MVSAGEIDRANPRGIPTSMLGTCGVLIAVGLIAFVGGLVSDADTAWRAFHVNLMYFMTLSLGGLMLSCPGHWQRGDQLRGHLHGGGLINKLQSVFICQLAQASGIHRGL